MRSSRRSPVSKIAIPLLSLIALPLVLAVSSSVTASEYACDGFVGSFATQPDDEAAFKVVKDSGGFALLVHDDNPDAWERMPLNVGLSEDVRQEMLAEGGKLIPVTCSLWAEGILLWQFPDGSPDNPSESSSRNLSRYPQKTPYIMIVNGGVAAGESGLYPVRAKD